MVFPDFRTKECNWETRNGSVDGRGGRVKRLNGVDALMLYSETPEIHMHTLKIGVLDVSGVDGFSFEMFRGGGLPAFDGPDAAALPVR